MRAFRCFWQNHKVDHFRFCEMAYVHEDAAVVVALLLLIIIIILITTIIIEILINAPPSLAVPPDRRIFSSATSDRKVDFLATALPDREALDETGKLPGMLGFERIENGRFLSDEGWQ